MGGDSEVETWWVGRTPGAPFIVRAMWGAGGGQETPAGTANSLTF